MYKQQGLNKDSKEPKPFWNACKLYFTNKHSKGDTSIMLVEKEELILSEKKICSTFNKYFSNIVCFQW